MKIMVTGAGGFIGSNLCNMLAVEHQVLAISRKFDNLSKNIICKKYDLAEYHNLENEFSSFNPDVVIHCAWQGGNTSKDFDALWQINNVVFGNELLKLCSKHNVKHFIGFGSGNEFGDYSEKFYEELKCQPVNQYGISKYTFKMVSKKYCLDNNLKYSWVVPIFSYGPNDIETRLIPKVINAFLNQKDLVLNKCSAIVDYLYIDDFCNGVLQIIENELDGEFVISSDNEYQVRNIVEIIHNIIKPNSKLVFDENIPEHGFRYICGTSKKLKYKSNWKPEVTLEEGLIRTINYFKSKF
jgi:nucleoside-diphosphate-sugar epimerase